MPNQIVVEAAFEGKSTPDRKFYLDLGAIGLLPPLGIDLYFKVKVELLLSRDRAESQKKAFTLSRRRRWAGRCG